MKKEAKQEIPEVQYSVKKVKLDLAQPRQIVELEKVGVIMKVGLDRTGCWLWYMEDDAGMNQKHEVCIVKDSGPILTARTGMFPHFQNSFMKDNIIFHAFVQIMW